MSCNLLMNRAGPAPLWHRAFCRECRIGSRADRLVEFAIDCRKSEPAPLSALSRTLRALDLPHSMGRHRRIVVSRFARRVAVGSAVIIVGAGYGWTRYIDREPYLTITTSAISGPNAFDDFRLAAARIKGESTVSKMLSSTESELRRVAAGVGGGTVIGTDPMPQQPEYSAGDRARFIDLNKPALEAVRAGLGKEYLAPAIRSSSMDYSYMGKNRSLTGLLRLESEVYADRGQWAKAAGSAIDAIAVGVKVQQNASLMGKLHGIGCESMGRDALWPVVDRLSAAEARAAANRLQNVVNFRWSFQGALLEEQNVTLALLDEQMRRPDWRRTVFQIRNGNTGLIEEPVPGWASYLRMLPYTKMQIVENLQKRMAREMEDASKDWQTRPDNYIRPFERSDPVTEMIAPVFEGARFQDLLSVTQNALLITRLRLRAHFAGTGRYPQPFDSFTRDYLPQDPFAPYRWLTYRVERNRPLLYSVGPDGVDDSGRPISNSDRQGGNVQPASRGDIVAGVHRS